MVCNFYSYHKFSIWSLQWFAQETDSKLQETLISKVYILLLYCQWIWYWLGHMSQKYVSAYECMCLTFGWICCSTLFLEARGMRVLKSLAVSMAISLSTTTRIIVVGSVYIKIVRTIICAKISVTRETIMARESRISKITTSTHNMTCTMPFCILGAMKVVTPGTWNGRMNRTSIVVWNKRQWRAVMNCKTCRVKDRMCNILRFLNLCEGWNLTICLCFIEGVKYRLIVTKVTDNFCEQCCYASTCECRALLLHHWHQLQQIVLRSVK